jgi:diketogulonate reductase-like aldo/keto reductase
LLLKEFGRTGVKVSEIGLGTYYDPLWIATAFVGWRRDEGAKVRAIRFGFEAGITLVDTAEIYCSEPLVGKALEQVRRDDVFLATKVSPNHLHRDDLVRSLEKSLRRLGVGYVDLYQVHWPNPRVPLGETMGAMEELVRSGKVRYVGVSNFDLEQIREANSALPKSQLSAVQLEYSLVNKRVEKEILPYCEANEIAFLAYYPLGHGRLVSSPRVDGVAMKYGKTRSQTALRWLVGKRVVFPIPRASKVTHVQENAGASEWELAPEDVAQLEARFV